MNNSEKWLEKDQQDFNDATLAEMSLGNRLYHCQQAAEKTIKTVLVSYEKDYPFTHDVGELLTVVEKYGIELPAELKKAGSLTKYAVQTKYPPRDDEKWDEKEYINAKRQARRTVKWAEDFIVEGNFTLD